jgi:hypothetical protein
MASGESNEEAAQRRRILLTVGASLAVLVIGFVLALVYDVGGLRSRAVNNVSEAYSDVVFRNMRETCIKSANDTVRQSGGNPDAPDVTRKLTGYCDCFVTDARTQFTVAEIAELEKDPNGIAGNPKVKAIIDRCVAQYIKS